MDHHFICCFYVIRENADTGCYKYSFHDDDDNEETNNKKQFMCLRILNCPYTRLELCSAVWVSGKPLVLQENETESR